MVVLLLSANEASVDGSAETAFEVVPFRSPKNCALGLSLPILVRDSFFFPRTLAWCVHQVKARDDCRQDKSLFKVTI